MTDPTLGDYDLEERQALRRVAGLSTELADVTEVEYRQLRLERVVLVGVWTDRHADRRRELAAPSWPGSPRPPARWSSTALIQRRDRPDPATYIGSGKAKELRDIVSGTRRRHRHLRRRAHPGPAAPARGRRQGQGRRPHRADPRHLRPARPLQGGQGAGRAGPAAVPASAAARLGRVAVPAGRWPGGGRAGHRRPRPG